MVFGWLLHGMCALHSPAVMFAVLWAGRAVTSCKRRWERRWVDGGWYKRARDGQFASAARSRATLEKLHCLEHSTGVPSLPPNHSSHCFAGLPPRLSGLPKNERVGTRLIGLGDRMWGWGGDGRKSGGVRVGCVCTEAVVWQCKAEPRECYSNRPLSTDVPMLAFAVDL